MILGLLFLLQASLPTVGDTIWVSRAVRVPPGYAVRPAPWQPTGVVEVLGRSSVTTSGDSAIVRYPVVAWEPGTHRLEVPGPLLLGPNGETDSLPTQAVSIRVRSILPPELPDSAMPIQPQVGLVPRGVVSLLPVLMLWGVALILMLPVTLWWRRRGRPAPARQAPALPPPPIARWADAGEQRAVATAAAARLRAAIAGRVPEAHVGLEAEVCIGLLTTARPAWPLEEIARVIRLLEVARFAPVVAGEATALYQRASDLSQTIGAEAS